MSVLYRFTPAPLRDWLATVTEDNGETSKKIRVQASTYTEACVLAMIQTDGFITELSEMTAEEVAQFEREEKAKIKVRIRKVKNDNVKANIV